MALLHFLPQWVALLAITSFAASTLASPVSGVVGDECLDPIVASIGLNGPVNTATMTASTNAPSSDECEFLAWTPTTKDAWWVYNAPAAGRLSLHFCASSYDTSVVVYQGSCGALVRRGCDDDGCAPDGPTYQSKIDGLPVAAGPVFIRVGGYAGATGTVRFTLGFEQEGRAAAWGRNSDGESAVPAALGPVAALAAGDAHNVALTPLGTVVCWGRNNQGQCTVPASIGASVIAIAAGQDHSAALRSTGTVVCWGSNAYGQCVVPSSIGLVTRIAAGAFHTIALRSDGSVVCWGYNNYGQCVVPGSLGPATAIAAGSFHTVARKLDGTVACWGSNVSGQCTVPGSLGPVLAIAAGDGHTVALKQNGAVACWGSNFFGQCTVPSSLGTVTAIAAGDSHTIALKQDGTVACWGSNSNGQCAVPTSLGLVTAVFGGGAHTLVVRPYTCAADTDGNGGVGASDLSGLLAVWGTNSATFDIDGDGTVGAGDLSLLLTSWGSCTAGAPSLSNVTPNFGTTAGGTRVTISGASLSAVNDVTIGGAAATNVIVLSPATVAAVTPPGTVGSKDVAAMGLTGTAVLPSGFRYFIVPSWATLIEANPDPAVVYLDYRRETIVRSGYAWRVRDKDTNIEMLLIPGGNFVMGCPDTNPGCDDDEAPSHGVSLTNAFYMGRFEVTQAQWTASMGSNPSSITSPSAEVPAAQVPNRPVETVSWETVQTFLGATGMRLPTEAEWEWACGSGSGSETAYHGYAGNPNGSNNPIDLTAIAWWDFNANSQTRPVGGKASNTFGLHDMLGNVTEWVSDWYAYDYYFDSPYANPTGPASGKRRVIRGGDYLSIAPFARITERSDRLPDDPSPTVGFRVARNP